MPLLAFLHQKCYKVLKLEGTVWDTKVTFLLILSLPLSAIFFLMERNKYFRAYGLLICIYIVYIVYDFLKQTSGAI